MDKARLGRTGLTVSVAALGSGGASRLGKTRGASTEESIGLVKAALDAGVTVFDTAYSYGTEELVGAGLKGVRDRVVISTKLPIVVAGSPEKGTDLIDAKELTARFETSLSRLGTDYIDILHLHGVCPHQYDHSVNVLLPTLLKWRDEGKVRHLALAERFQADTTHEMLARAIEDDVWDVVMVALNPLNLTALRHVLPRAKERDIGVMCMYAVRGKLASAERTRPLVEEGIKLGEIDPRGVDLDNPLGFLLGAGGGSSLTDACYRFCRHAPGIDLVLTGTGNLDHLRANLRSINGAPLAPEIVEKTRKAFGKVQSLTAD